MADETIYSSVDGMAGRTGTTSWSDTQTGTATTFTDTATHHSAGVYSRTISGRLGTTYYNNRSFFAFDCSSASGTVDEATVKIYCDNIGSTGILAGTILTGASSISTAVDTGDYGNVYSSGTTWFDNYSSVVSISTTAGYHSFVLNSDGISALQSAIGSGGTFTCALVSNISDHVGAAPSGGGDYTRIAVTYKEWVSTIRDPKLEINYAITDNATFFGANF